jgi:TRAP-type C4-dicarboxylate transport system substrate-binding protein
VLDGFKHGAGVQTKFNKNQEDIANETFIKGGGSIYEPNAEERETFLFARDAMMDWYKEKYGDEWLNILMEAVDKAKAEAGSTDHFLITDDKSFLRLSFPPPVPQEVS